MACCGRRLAPSLRTGALSIRLTVRPAVETRGFATSSIGLAKKSGKPSLASQVTAAPSEAEASRVAKQAAVTGEQLDWPTYLSLRRTQRRYNLLASIPTTVLGLSLGVSYFAAVELDQSQTIMGIDPVFIYGAATLGCVGAGYLVGPLLGGFVWRTTHSKVRKAMEGRDREFFEHIKRLRVDPSQSSTSNPVPDYYGEKVTGFKEYRRWLRDQRAYRRKASFGKDAE